MTKKSQADEPKLEEEVKEEPKLEDESADEEDTAASLNDLETPTPSASTPLPLGSKARAMRDQLAKEPKVRVFIPLANGEKQGVTQSVILNGYPMYIGKAAMWTSRSLLLTFSKQK
jgi:hypothetical protein